MFDRATDVVSFGERIAQYIRVHRLYMYLIMYTDAHYPVTRRELSTPLIRGSTSFGWP